MPRSVSRSRRARKVVEEEDSSRSPSPPPARKTKAAKTPAPPAPAPPAPIAVPEEAAPRRERSRSVLGDMVEFPNKSGPPRQLLLQHGKDWEQYSPSSAYLSGRYGRDVLDYLPSGWVNAWFWLTTVIVAWDAGYCLLPRSVVEEGWGATVWSPYHTTYRHLDQFYDPARDNGFGVAQAWLNALELVGNVLFLFLSQALLAPSAPVVGLVVATSTFMKTLLYHVMIFTAVLRPVASGAVVPAAAAAAAGGYVSPFEHGGAAAIDRALHGDFGRDLLLFAPNFVWLVVPLLVMASLAGKLTAGAGKLVHTE